MKTYHTAQGALFKCSVLKNWEVNPEKRGYLFMFI